MRLFRFKKKSKASKAVLRENVAASEDALGASTAPAATSERAQTQTPASEVSDTSYVDVKDGPGGDIEAVDSKVSEASAPAAAAPFDEEAAVPSTTSGDAAEEPPPAIATPPSADEAPTSAASLSKSMSGDGYVNVGGKSDGAAPPSEDYVRIEEGDLFDGVKGTVQSPEYKDLKYAYAFVAHFGFFVWWLVETIVKENALAAPFAVPLFVLYSSVVGIVLSSLAVRFVLGDAARVLKVLAVLGLFAGWTGLYIGEDLPFFFGFGTALVLGVYVTVAGSKFPFTAEHFAAAGVSIEMNKGLDSGVLFVCFLGFVWLAIAVPAAEGALKFLGNWTWWIILLSYYWTHQVLANLLAVTTAGTIGRWIVTGEETTGTSSGMSETFTRARTYNFGSICRGSLLGDVHRFVNLPLRLIASTRILEKLSNSRLLAHERLAVVRGGLASAHATAAEAKPLLPKEWAYTYVGLYGYSYDAATANTSQLLANKGWLNVVKEFMASNLIILVNLTVGILTGACGRFFAHYTERFLWAGGMSDPNPDGFYIAFLVGFLMSSTMLGVVTATVNTMVVCSAESPEEFNTNHPELHKKLQELWEEKAEALEAVEDLKSKSGIVLQDTSAVV